jgi:nucleotide-binding universal stress UspA family protein
MKILLAVNGSPYTERIVKALISLNLASENEIEVTTVVPGYTFLGDITIAMLNSVVANKKSLNEAQQKKAEEIVNDVRDKIQTAGYSVTTSICWGKPAEQIINKAREIGADLLIIGARGMSDSSRFPIGSIAQKVMKYSHTNVLIAREREPKIRRILIAYDGSKHSNTAIRFLQDLPLPPQSHIFPVTVVQSHMEAIVKTPTLNLETNQHILEELKAMEEEAGRKLLENAGESFRKNGYKVSPLLLKGEPAEEILNAADTLNPELIVVGARGLSGIETFFLGSVSQRVARFANYSVLIVREPIKSRRKKTAAPVSST